MGKKDLSRLDEFLLSLLNLQKVTTKTVREFLEKCNEVLPVRNFEDCLALVLATHNPKAMSKAYRELPVRSDKKPGEFFRTDLPSFSSSQQDLPTTGTTNTRDHGMIIAVKWSPKPGRNVEDFAFYGVLRSILFGEIEDLKALLTSLMECMAASTGLSDLGRHEAIRSLSSAYPQEVLTIDDNLIEKRLDYPQIWGLDSDYIRRCVSYAFFEFFLEPVNFKRIKRCEICRRFFVARDLKRKRCYSQDCERQYHKRDMRKRRSEDPGDGPK